MASMREIKLRIMSIKETQHITKAMKLISASKLKKARQLLELTLPYFNKIKQTMADILSHSENVESPYFETREKEDRRVGFIALTGDKGLAGGYNHNILDLIRKLAGENKNHALFVAGRLGKIILTREGYAVDNEFDYPVMNPTVYRARDMGEYVLGLYDKAQLDEVHLVFTQMVTSLHLEPTTIKLLPLDLDALREALKSSAEITSEPDSALAYEPSVSAVLHVLIPKYITGIIYGALVEAFTSEQSARMNAMDSATENADEMLQSLNLFFNRARQASITQEISEVVGGAAALQ